MIYVILVITLIVGALWFDLQLSESRIKRIKGLRGWNLSESGESPSKFSTVFDVDVDDKIELFSTGGGVAHIGSEAQNVPEKS